MTTHTAILNVRTDPKIKKAAQKAAEELGVSLSMVVNAALRSFIAKPRLEIELVPNAKTARILRAAMKEPRGKVFDSVEEFIADLNA